MQLHANSEILLYAESEFSRYKILFYIIFSFEAVFLLLLTKSPLLGSIFFAILIIIFVLLIFILVLRLFRSMLVVRRSL